MSKHRTADPSSQVITRGMDPTKYQTLSCRDAGAFDHTHGLKAKLTGWGVISKARAASGLSRKARIAKRA